MRAPLHPIGCPRGIAPPVGVGRSRGVFRARTRASPFGVAGMGPTPMVEGSTPATAEAMIRARGTYPRAAAPSAAIRSTPAAPSLIPEELPAGTAPAFLDHGG